jgi:hypothetical protein
MVSDMVLEAALAGECGDLLASFMSRCIIIRAEHILAMQCTLYHAFCMDFAETPQGENPPMYTLEIARDGGETSMRFVPSQISGTDRPVKSPALGQG